MRRSTQDLLGMSSKLTAGTQVSVIHEGQKYEGIITACNYASDKYIISFNKRFIKETIIIERRGCQITPLYDIEPQEVEDDYEDYYIGNML